MGQAHPQKDLPTRAPMMTNRPIMYSIIIAPEFVPATISRVPCSITHIGHPAHAAGLAGQKKNGYTNPVMAIPNIPSIASMKNIDWLTTRR